MSEITRRLLVSGHVQGVSYRWWTIGAATALGLTGWVRNVGDDRVEIVATGIPEAIDRLVEQCHAGPRGARVHSVETSEIRFERFGSFTQHPSI